MRLGELRAAVEAVCGGGFSHDSTRHFNSCMRNLAAKSATLLSRTVEFVSGEWTIPNNVLAVHSLTYGGQSIPVRVFEPAQMISPTQGSSPTAWMKIGGKILLHPRPNEPINVEVFYTGRPTPLELDDDTPEIADADDVLIAYAIWQIKRDEDDLQVANERGNEYYRAETEWLSLNGKKNPAPKRISFNLW